MSTPCEKCNGSGEYEYSDTSTYNSGAAMFAGQAFTWDVCDQCWGTGDQDNPGENLRTVTP